MHNANLRDANLQNTVWHESDLNGADLSRADVRGADFTKAYLDNVVLRELVRDKTTWPNKFIELLVAKRTIVPEGDIIGWKKLADGSLAKLLIPAGVARVGGCVGRECRAAMAHVLEGNGVGFRDRMYYNAGEDVIPSSFDPDPLVEYAPGVHFFVSKMEAEEYR